MIRSGNLLISGNGRFKIFLIKMSKTTTRELLNVSRELRRTYSTPQMDQILEEEAFDVYQRELELLAEHRSCPLERSEMAEKLTNLSPQDLKAKLSRDFDNAAVMRATSCIVDGIFFPTTNLTLAERIKGFIKEVRQIGTPSAFGVAMTGSYENASDVFVLKSPQDPLDRSLVHELFIGIFGTNPLRNQVPNFVYVFGGFRCSPPIVLTQRGRRDVVSWCHSSNIPVQYVLYENVSPSISFADYVRSCSPEEFLAQFLQVMYSIRTALIATEFTHYDLHTENVLVRTIAKPMFSIPYDTEMGREYLLTDRVITIIDYGISYMRYQGKSYGIWDRIWIGVPPNRPFILSSVYKFLMFCISDAKRAGNTGVARVGEIMFRFFNTVDSIDKALTDQWPTRYALFLVPGLEGVSLDDFLNYVRSNFNVKSILRPKPGSEEVLGCSEGELCSTLDDILSEIREKDPYGTPGAAPPDNLFELYDIIGVSQRVGDTERIRDAQEKFAPFYDAAKDAEIRKIEGLRTQYDQLASSINVIMLTPEGEIDYESILNPTTVSSYRKYIQDLVQILDKHSDMRLRSRILYTIAPLYEDVTTENYASEQLEALTETEDELRLIKNQVIRDAAYLNTIVDEPQVRALRSRYPDINWFWDGLGVYMPAIES